MLVRRGREQFVVYLFGFYGRIAAGVQLKSRSQPFLQTSVPEDSMHTIKISIHIALTAFVAAGSLLQETTGAHRLFLRIDRESAWAYYGAKS